MVNERFPEVAGKEQEKSSCYFSVNRIAIPFQWEEAPGTPKQEHGHGDGDDDYDGDGENTESSNLAKKKHHLYPSSDSYGVPNAVNLHPFRIYPLPPPPNLHAQASSLHAPHPLLSSFRFLSFRSPTSSSSSAFPLSKSNSSLSLHRHHQNLLQLMQQSRNFSELAQTAASADQSQKKTKKLHPNDPMLVYIVASADEDYALPLQQESGVDKNEAVFDAADDDDEDLDQRQVLIHPAMKEEEEEAKPEKRIKSPPKLHFFTSCWR